MADSARDGRPAGAGNSRGGAGAPGRSSGGPRGAGAPFGARQPTASGSGGPAAGGRAGTPAGRPNNGPAGGGARGGGRPAGGAPARRGATREEIAQREYDPRREERRKATRVALPDDVDPRMLDADARRELRSLSKETAELVARHLVVTGQLLDEEPERALAHARAARALAGRVGVVREAAGLAAYAAGEWSDALSELRAARRITGRPEHLAVLADCERALGRPERALAYADDPQVNDLTQDQRVELIIVLAGARRDLGQADAGVLVLQDPARRTSDKRPWAARLWYAYADALLDAGREQQAREWFAKAAEVDVDGQTDAGDRLLALEGIVLEDDEDEAAERDDLLSPDELAALVRDVPVPGAAREQDADGPDAPATAGAAIAEAGAPAAGDGAASPPAAADGGQEPGQRSADAHAAALFRPAPASDEAQAAPTGRSAEEPPGPEPAARPRAVAPPVFVAAPVEAADEDDLRLFD